MIDLEIFNGVLDECTYCTAVIDISNDIITEKKYE